MSLKSSIRKHKLAEIDALPIAERRNFGIKIKNRLFSLPEYDSAKTICSYVSFCSEVETYDIIKESIAAGKRVIVPKIDLVHKVLLLSEINSFDELKQGAYGILEPDMIRPANIDEIDLFIVPGIAFDRAGNRLGRGKGYYDKLLSSTSSVKIGLAYEIQLEKEIPHDNHDIKIDIVLTEKDVYRC